jgi:hypothetical protein
MVVPGPEHWIAPWERQRGHLRGEEDPLVLARTLGVWWGQEAEPRPAAVVGVDPARSPGRWAAAPTPDRGSLLLLPRGAFAGPLAQYEAALREVWPSGKVADEWTEQADLPVLVLVVSAEPPGSFADRLVAMARSRTLRGRVLAALCLSGPPRRDLPARLLAEGNLAGFGLAQASIETERQAGPALAAIAAALRAGPVRPERLPGPFLWFY